MLGNTFEIKISKLSESLPSFTGDEKILNFFGSELQEFSEFYFVESI